ncbi:MAG: hypothetical protein A2X35_00380 [Elusimicrobia bacterium GWA2_61_42]|nr:MAG: hypothetical protein A2X35_00380 [Elusimicrobia bacterium GWA2_61_42]OGR74551.1 MAG: hypothetical protein A2X38_08130 [Elusimicrobia bacterium GWC2_61_25]
MRCPKCGAEIEGGKAYCSNPACGAVPGQAKPASRYVVVKNLSFNLSFDFVKLARLGALLIAILAAAYLYFFAKR